MQKSMKHLILALALAASPTWCLAAISLPEGGGNDGGGTTTEDPFNQDTTPEETGDPVADTMALCKANPRSCGITLEDILGQIQFGETEPNNHFLSADVLTPEIPMPGQLYSQTDQDWFVFETTEDNMVVTTLFTGADNSLQIVIRDTDGNILASNDAASGEDFGFDTTLAHAGTYYASVEASIASGDFTNAGYQVMIVLNSSSNASDQPAFNFHDAETEFNDYFTTADVLVSNLVTTGQLHYTGDRDVYRLDSVGNEIVHLELCYPNTSCFDENTWAMFVFEGALVTDAMLDTFTIQCISDESDGNGDGATCRAGNEVYWNYDTLVAYGQALVGVIDPSFGDEYSLDLGIDRPGTYYVVIAAVLEEGDEGTLLHRGTAVDFADDPVSIVYNPWSEDMYTMRVIKTSLGPSTNTEFGDILDQARAKFDADTLEVHIPEIKVGNEMYSADMHLVPNSGPITLQLDKLELVDTPIVLQ